MNPQPVRNTFLVATLANIKSGVHTSKAGKQKLTRQTRQFFDLTTQAIHKKTVTLLEDLFNHLHKQHGGNVGFNPRGNNQGWQRQGQKEL